VLFASPCPASSGERKPLSCSLGGYIRNSCSPIAGYCSQTDVPLPRLDKRTTVVVSLLFIAALAARLIGLDQHFLLIDEAFVGVAARDIAFNHTPMWDAVSNAPYVWGLAQMISAFGDNAFVLRLPSAIFGASVSILIFLFISRWAGERVAILSAAIYALHPFALAFTRVAFVDALQLPAIWLAIFALDRYFEDKKRKWLLTALASATLAFIFKYNAIAVIGCWMFVGMLLGRYSIKTSLWLGGSIIAVSFATLLLWPYDAPLWFFSFLAKGGSYNGQYIWDFYHYAYRHVTFGSATLPIALLSYLLQRSGLPKNQAKRYDHYILFGLAYFGLLLYLGRPFQRYLLVLTIPVAIVYSMLIVQGYSLLREWMASKQTIALVRAAAGIAVLCGVLIQGTRSTVNYMAYLNNDLDLASAQQDLANAERIFWPEGSPVVAAYYLGFSQYYSLAERGALDTNMSRHYFLGSTSPYSADTLPYGVLLARDAMKRQGFFNAILHPRSFGEQVKQLDARVDSLKRERASINYYDSEFLQPGDLLVETRGIVDQNGEPMLYPLESGGPAENSVPPGFELVSAYLDGKRYSDTVYHRSANQGEVRILTKQHAR
jgi:hypothetical protein